MRKYTYRFLLVILTLTTVITTNCSSVDDDTKEPEIPEVKLLPVRIVNEIADKTIELEYNEHNQLVEYQIFHSENISDHIKIFYDG